MCCCCCWLFAIPRCKSVCQDKACHRIACHHSMSSYHLVIACHHGMSSCHLILACHHVTKHVITHVFLGFGVSGGPSGGKFGKILGFDVKILLFANGCGGCLGKFWVFRRFFGRILGADFRFINATGVNSEHFWGGFPLRTNRQRTLHAVAADV